MTKTFFCQACLEDKPVSACSPDVRYCNFCNHVIKEAEAERIRRKEEREREKEVEEGLDSPLARRGTIEKSPQRAVYARQVAPDRLSPKGGHGITNKKREVSKTKCQKRVTSKQPRKHRRVASKASKK